MATGEVLDEGEAHTPLGEAALEHAEHGAGVFPPFDPTWFPSQLLWLAITFVAFYYLMANVALPRIAGILESRRDRIASDLDTAQRLKQESDEAVAGYEAALADARANAFGIAEEARETARSEVEARRAEIEAELADKLAAAESRISEIKGEALRQVGAIASEAAGDIVTKLAGLTSEPSEIEAAVSGAMEERQADAG